MTSTQQTNTVQIEYPEFEDNEDAVNSLSQISMTSNNSSRTPAFANEQNVNDPSPSRKILQSNLPPFPVTRPQEFLYAPAPYKADLYEPDDLESINPIVHDKDSNEKRKLTWKEAFEFEQSSSSAFDIEFLIKFPTRLHQVSEIKWVDIVFGLPNDIYNYQDLYEHMQKNDGAIKLQLDAKQTALLFSNVPNFRTKDANVIPLEISVVKEHVELYDDFQGILSTSAINHSDSKPKRRILWSQTGGIHNMASGTEANVHHLIAQKSQFDSRQNKKLLFLAEAELYNSADFLRWINVNRKDVFEEIETATDPTNKKRINIKCPAETALQADTIIQATVISYKKQLNKFSEKIDEHQPFIQQNDRGESFFILSKQAILNFFNEIFDAIDQNRIMMRLDDLQFQLKPLRGIKAGKERFDKDMQSNSSMAQAKPRYLVLMQMAFVHCTHK